MSQIQFGTYENESERKRSSIKAKKSVLKAKQKRCSVVFHILEIHDWKVKLVAENRILDFDEFLHNYEWCK